MKIACCVFDLDDTLYLERDYVRSGFQAVAAWLEQTAGPTNFFQIAWELFEQGGRGTIFNQVLARLGLSAEPGRIQQMVEVYRTHRPRIQLLPDAEKCIKRLRSQCRLGVITDGPAASQRAKIEALELNKYMDTIIVTSEYGPGYDKTHPRAFLQVLAELHLDPEQCAYIGDNPAKDFTVPLQLKWKVLRIKRPGGLHSSAPCLENGDPIPTILSLDGLEQYLGEIDRTSGRLCDAISG